MLVGTSLGREGCRQQLFTAIRDDVVDIPSCLKIIDDPHHGLRGGKT